MYKGRKTLLGIVMLIAMTAVAVFSVIAITNTENKTEERCFPEKIANVIANTEESAYRLSVYEGYVAVFHDDDLVYMSNIEADSLRHMDKEILKSGIKANSYNEILQLLEDFGS